MKVDEYDRRIDLCGKAVAKATEKLGLRCHFASDYQGIEIRVDTETGIGKVIILMDTGHGPRFPKYVTLSVHGYVEKYINSKVNICSGGIASSESKFLPDQISTKWLHDAISKTASAIRSICTIENMEKLKVEALALRRQALKNSPLARYGSTTLHIKD